MSTVLKKDLCRSWKLYVITSEARGEDRSLKERVRLAVRGGAGVIQLRDKSASDAELAEKAGEILSVTRPENIPMIINDRILVAKASGAQGVHLGQEDGSLERARSILGPDAILGRSTHSPEQAIEAYKEGFDYIGIGPVFETPTKPGVQPVGLELVRFASQNIPIPFVAIGGIDLENVDQVLEAGARCVAVVRAVMSAVNPKKESKKIISRIEKFYENKR